MRDTVVESAAAIRLQENSERRGGQRTKHEGNGKSAMKEAKLKLEP